MSHPAQPPVHPWLLGEGDAASSVLALNIAFGLDECLRRQDLLPLTREQMLLLGAHVASVLYFFNTLTPTGQLDLSEQANLFDALLARLRGLDLGSANRGGAR